MAHIGVESCLKKEGWYQQRKTKREKENSVKQEDEHIFTQSVCLNSIFDAIISS